MKINMMKKYTYKTLTTVLFLVAAFSAQTQTIHFESNRWEIDAKESRVEEYLGRQSLRLKGGLALVKESKFLNGVIEFDIAFSEERNFVGTIWRVQDTRNYEEFYFRPHQSGNPDANQYSPVFNGVSGWQLYYGEEFSAPVRYRFNEWMHIKEIKFGFSDRVRVYLNDRLLYAGYDQYTSRDYRFLGTVGFWDALYLPLKKGRNELWMAVSENFGGWGIQAAIEDRSGIQIE